MNRTRHTGFEGAADSFLRVLADSQPSPLLKSADGTLRFDVVDGDEVDQTFVTIKGGKVSLPEHVSRPDAIVRLRRETYDAMFAGAVNATSAVLRGDVVIDGDHGLLLLFQRVLRSPPRGEHV